jgi:ketose-bisphosphate aldolase
LEPGVHQSGHQRCRGGAIPVIIGFNEGLLATHKRELKYYAAVGKVAVKKATVPVVLPLNEASGFHQIVRGIRYGFSAVRIDGSFLPFDKNISLTKKVVEVAHSVNVCVKAQLDTLSHARDGVFLGEVEEAYMTEPERVAEFVDETGIDALSISIGNIHALRKGEAKIDFGRPKEIRKLVDVPLVAHGATGISDDPIKEAIQLGICKVDIGTALRLAFTNGIRKALGKGQVERSRRDLRIGGARDENFGQEQNESIRLCLKSRKTDE